MRYGADWDHGAERMRGRGHGARYGADYGGRERGRYGRDFEAPRGYGRDFGARRGHGRDDWWIGEHAMPRGGRNPYDAAYGEEGDGERWHPRFSPVGGMYPSMGGRYAFQRAPRPLREPMRFSEWTRWF